MGAVINAPRVSYCTLIGSIGDLLKNPLSQFPNLLMSLFAKSISHLDRIRAIRMMQWGHFHTKLRLLRGKQHCTISDGSPFNALQLTLTHCKLSESLTRTLETNLHRILLHRIFLITLFYFFWVLKA